MKLLIVDSSPLKLVRAINEAADSLRCVSAINVASTGGEGALLKFGVYPNKVGLQVFDREAAEAMVRASNSLAEQAADLFRGLPIYVGHPDDEEWAKKNPTVRMEAVGRMPKLSVEAEGLRIRTAYNDQGKKLLSPDAPTFDSFSPNWGMVPITYQGRKAFRPVELYSIGLTNKPNIPGCYIGLNEALPPENSPVMKSHIIALLAAIGRPIANAAAVTDEQLVTAVNEALPTIPQLVAAAGELPTVKTALQNACNEMATYKGQLAAANGQVTTAVNEAATLRTSLATERAARAGVVITSAVNEGRITEAQRAEWLGKFTATGADFAGVATELNKLTKAVNTKSKAELGDRRGDGASKSKIRAINEAIAAKKTSGLSHDAAYAAVREEKPDLFSNEK